jgi:YegS/Rv2252/BmrU family lipid kinase
MPAKDKKPRLKLIANPGAGKTAETGINLEIATHILQDYGLHVDVAFAHPKKEASPMAARAVEDGYKTIIAMGGDGTIEAVIRGMMDAHAGQGRKTRLGILPVGSANNIARSLGVPLDLKEACALIASGPTRKVDLGRVKVGKNEPFYFLELVAVGLTAALYPEAKKLPKGDLSTIKDLVSTLVQHETNPKIFLKLDGESLIEIETLLATVSNTPVYGMNFLVAPTASLQDGLLDISLYPNFTKAELLAYYARVMNEGYSGNGNIQRYRAQKLKIKSRPGLEVMADGVMQGKGTVRIKVFPQVLKVISPDENAGLAVPPEKFGDEEAVLLPLGVNEEINDEVKEG